MEEESKEKKGLSAQELIMFSRSLSGTGIRRKGYFESEAIRLILTKLGVTEEETKQLRINAIRQSKKIANEFQESIKNNPLPVDEIVSLMTRELNNNWTPPLQTRDHPMEAGGLRVYPDTPNSHCYLQHQGQKVDNSKNLPWFSYGRAGGNIIKYEFGISHTGHYNFTLPAILCGPYFLLSDDGPSDDEFAELVIYSSFTINKIKDNKKELFYYNGNEFFKNRITNERILDNLIIGVQLGSVAPKQAYNPSNGNVTTYDTKIYIPFTAGEILSVELQLHVNAIAIGNCSMVSADFNPGTGVLYNPYMDVTWIANP